MTSVFKVWIGDRLQVERVGFVCRIVLVDGSVQNRYRISEKFGNLPMDSTPGLQVLCYLVGRITSLVKPVLNTSFVPCDLK